MSYKKWVVANNDKILAKKIAEECDIDPIAALILSSRGYTDLTEIDQLISDDPIISSHKELIDIDVAVDCIKTAIGEDVLIGVYGDYDCDGITATALLLKYFREKNVRCIYYIPDRFSEGYGMNKDAIDTLYSKGVGLIITVDNGISSIDEIEYANKLGIKTVITDHHLPKEELPNAQAVINPHRDTSPYVFKDICGTVVAYKLICALEDKECEELLDKYSDFLAVATVGDIMSLKDENRDIVKYGIKKIKYRPSNGLEALISVAGINRNDINSTKIAFGIVPRINAAGRMGNATRAVELLLSEDIMNSLEIANAIDADNAERHRIETEIFKDACKIIEEENYQYNRVIVVSGDNWHCGVVGIVASRIAEKYGKPTIVLSQENAIATGSGRSVGDFCLFDAINHCSDLLIKFGGHSAAAGLTIETQKISEFRNKINQYAQVCEYAPATLKLDCKLNAAALSTDICYSFIGLEPFGHSNPAPLFGLFGCEIQKITPIGSGKHLRILFSKDSSVFQAVLFGTNEENFAYKIGDTVDLAVSLEINHYAGNENLSIRIKDMRLSHVDEQKLFNDIKSSDNLLSGIIGDYSDITPTREDVVEIYRTLAAPKTFEQLTNQFLKTLGYGKVFVSITVLRELNLIEYSGEKLSVVKNANKTDLLNSPLYKKLLEKEA